MMNKNAVNQKGQALLFVVIAMTIALGIGINASVRTITSLSRTARTDTATRALAAAEGGIERFLPLSGSVFESAITNNTCPVGQKDPSGACAIDFEGSDDLVSQALVTVERYKPEYYSFNLESGQVKEINLYDFTTDTYYEGDKKIKICWTPRGVAEITYFAYRIKGQTGEVTAHGGLTTNFAANPGQYHSENFVSAQDKSGEPYTACGIVDIDSKVYGLRIRSVGGESSVGIYPTPGYELPLQGYLIKSIGSIKQDEDVTATRTIKVVRTLPYLPSGFDFAAYTTGNIIKVAHPDLGIE